MHIEDIGLPDEVKVGGFVCKIVTGLEDMTLEDEPIMGRFEPNNKEIQISSKVVIEGESIVLSAAVRWATFFHELLHAMDSITGHCLKNGRYLGESKYDAGERVTDTMAEALFTVFRDNPQLCEAIATIEDTLDMEAEVTTYELPSAAEVQAVVNAGPEYNV